MILVIKIEIKISIHKLLTIELQVILLAKSNASTI